MTDFFGSASKKSPTPKVTISDPNSLKVSLIRSELDMGGTTHAGEGRSITLELDSFFLVACYVPNSGQNLDRLGYRLNDWEPDMRAYLKRLNQSKPVVYCGDLNVAHLDLDIYNHDAKHIVKQSGCTPGERKAFGDMLNEGFVDAFRHFYAGNLELG